MHKKVLSGNKYQAKTVDSVWDALRSWAQETASSVFPHEKLELLGNRKLTSSANKGRDAELPYSALFAQVDTYLDARDAVDAFIERSEISLVHTIRTLGQQRLAAMKQRQQVQSFDDLINDLHAALDGDHAKQLINALRARYAVALVDEFQDTDARQWSIFRRVFGSDDAQTGIDAVSTHALFLIGDPKQAIYRFRGGDVHTYLDAAATVETDNRYALRRNFRSRPLLLDAVNALYANAGASAFSEAGIDYEPVAPGGSITDASYQRDGRNAPALTLRVLPPPEHGGAAFNAETSREHAARACALEIHALLSESRAGSVSIDDEALKPGDIAVLVARHADAARMQRVLAECGIASVAAGRHSVLHGTIAQEIIWLLEALLHPADPSRMRAALASVLLGLNAVDIVRLEHDPDHKAQHALQLQVWAERWRRYGPLALLEAVCAANAPRLLTLADGERRLTDALQIAELLQEAAAQTTGLQGQLDWLQAQIADADREDEARQLRLESDADRVQIVTLHKSKGLEYPLVFLPFVGIAQSAKSSNVLEYYHDGRRVTQLQSARVLGEELAWKEAKSAASKQADAESMRLLYVGLTRARHALWLATGALYGNEKSALAKLPGARADAIDAAMIASSAIVMDRSPLPKRLPTPLPALSTQAPLVARVARRALRRDWWVYSFSQLARSPMQAFPAADADVDATVAAAANSLSGSAEDELHSTTQQATELQSGFGGARFGSALHEALENIVFERWLDWREPTPPLADAEALRAALRNQGYVDSDVELALPLLTTLLRETLNVQLPEGAPLAAMPESDRLAEMEFHFHMEPTSVETLIHLLHSHGLALQRHGFGLRRRIEGLMTGKIDLVYAFEGKLHVLDYKSNRLPDYSADTLVTAMRDSEYDLQYLIYTLALHRWLRFRRGDSYDYDRDMGGVRYLFCRGLDATAPNSPGMFACKPPRALIDALDALFASDALAREVTT
ncbi:MAG: exodeoxyribonuclease V subunit beta [Lysobacteraceae bacterium]